MSTDPGAPWPEPEPLDSDRDLPAFPVDALRGVLGRFAAGVATETQTPTEIAALLALVTVSVALAGRFEVRVRGAWREPCALWTASLAPPGARKSAVFSRVVGPLTELEANAIAAARPDVMRAASERRALERALGRAEQTLASAVGAGVEEQTARSDVYTLVRRLESHRTPTSARLVASDATPEAVAGLLCDTGGRLAIMSPESEPFALMLGRYGNGANYDVFLKGHAGDALQVDRKGGEPLTLRRAVLCLGLAVQPAALADVGARHAEVRGRGLPARFLYGMSPGAVGFRELDPDCADPADVEAYRALLARLLALPTDRDATGQLMPRVVELDAEAAAALHAHRADVEVALRPAGELAEIADWGSKLPGAAVRIAAVLHAARQDDPAARPINGDTMAAAVRIADWARPHALAAFGLLGAGGATDPRLPAARRVLGWLLGRPDPCAPVTDADAWRALRRGFRGSRDAFKGGVALLVELHHVRRAPPPRRTTPGRPPSPRLLVNPHHATGPPNPRNP